MAGGTNKRNGLKPAPDRYRTLEKYLLGKKGSLLDFPFGPDAAVFKLAGRMYALVAWEARPLCISLKCAPEDAVILRSMFDAVRPAYHMNKEHWNTVTLDGSIPDSIICELIDQSYALVAAKLSRADRKKLGIDGCAYSK
jgi:predicted DNA-binding protein (MmcQ/YjbR family)